MVKIAWKTINGYGPYAYLQESVRTDGKVISKHLLYLGAIGFGAFPGHHISYEGARILAPAVPGDVKSQLKPSAANKVSIVEDQLNAGVAPNNVVSPKKFKANKVLAPDPPPPPTGKVAEVLNLTATLKAVSAHKAKAPTKKAGAGKLPGQTLGPAGGGGGGGPGAGGPGSAAALPTGTSPKLGTAAVDASNKPLIKPFNVKKLEAAAATGDVKVLEDLGKELHDKMLDTNKKAAIANAVAELKSQMTGLATMEGHSGTDIANIIEEVDQGARKLPKQIIPKPSIVQQEIEKASQGTKNWDLDLEKISGKKGSNEGGLYKDKKLQTLHYAKWPGEDRARVEVLANRLYREAGVPTPNAALIELDGKMAVLSDWVDEVGMMTFAQMAKHKDVRRNFVVDAWLANWDVVGATADNIVKGPGNVAYRIDTGGSLVYRAQGKPKPYGFDVPELQSMRSTITAPQAAKVFTSLTSAELKAGAKAVAGVSDQQINEAVDQAAPNAAEALKQALKTRRDFIIVNVLNAKEPAPVTLKSLKTLGDLSDASIKLLQERHQDLVPAVKGSLRTATAKSIATKEFGSATKAEPSMSSIRTNYGEWKGSTTTTGGTMIRWGAAALEGGLAAGDEEIKALEAFWSFKAGGGSQPANQKFKDRRTEEGEALVSGLHVTRGANAVLMSLQHGGQDEVTLFRTWQPDQVKFFGWKDAQVGDLIKMPAEVYSHTLNPGVFAHGGLRTKVKVPVEKMLLTDRLNNPGGKFVSEDEVLYRAPITMEVIHV